MESDNPSGTGSPLHWASADWRWETLKPCHYLRGVAFERKAYRPYRPGWQHDHCNACMVKLAEPWLDDPDAVREGYATTAAYAKGADYDWVCVPCFTEFRDAMDWKDVTPAA